MTITAKVIADSISEPGIRITTLQLRYPKFIHGEFLTHRQFSRSSSSSRAIPVERLINDVINDPVMPAFWGRNQKGMSASEECDEPVNCPKRFFPGSREEAWTAAKNHAIDMARAFANAGYHKQIVNRLLEPFCHINTVVTSTEWSNFFALRRHQDAQPEMRLLAEVMHEAIAKSNPELKQCGAWHLPYAAESTTTDEAIKVSVARCARVSYLTQEGTLPSIGEDLKLYNRLTSSVPLHASPAEHQATPEPAAWKKFNLCGNFQGWVQYRKTLRGECQ